MTIRDLLAAVETIERIVAKYDEANPFRTADFHGTDCQCERCVFDYARHIVYSMRALAEKEEGK